MNTKKTPRPPKKRRSKDVGGGLGAVPKDQSRRQKYKHTSHYLDDDDDDIDLGLRFEPLEEE